jgi:prevent-host-death family protein
MKAMSAREAKNGFGLMIDTARAEPVLIEKHGRGVVVVVSVEDFARLNDASDPHGVHGHGLHAVSSEGDSWLVSYMLVVSKL